MNSENSNATLASDINDNKKLFKQYLPIDKSFDIIGRDLKFGDIEAYLIFIDGFAKDEIMLLIDRKSVV